MLHQIAALAVLPRLAGEPLLDTICEGVDDIVEEVYRSNFTQRVNAFDQTRINSFLQ